MKDTIYFIATTESTPDFIDRDEKLIHHTINWLISYGVAKDQVIIGGTDQRCICETAKVLGIESMYMDFGRDAFEDQQNTYVQLPQHKCLYELCQLAVERKVNVVVLFVNAVNREYNLLPIIESHVKAFPYNLYQSAVYRVDPWNPAQRKLEFFDGFYAFPLLLAQKVLESHSKDLLKAPIYQHPICADVILEPWQLESMEQRAAQANKMNNFLAPRPADSAVPMYLETEDNNERRD